MRQQALDLVLEEFGLKGVCSDAYEIIRQMAEPWSGTSKEASNLELLVRALALQCGSYSANEVRIIEPEKFSAKLTQAARNGGAERKFAQTLAEMCGVEGVSGVR